MTAGMGQSFTYDGANRLKTAGNGNSSFGYDGDGMRVKKSENGADTFYVKSSALGQTAMEVNSTGVMRAFVYSGGKMVAMQATDGQFYWLHTNHLGNARTMTDANGNVAYGGQFDPYGQTLAEWSATGNTNLNTKKFTGYERDSATGLDYANARMYNSARGRFTSPDPIGLKATNQKRPQTLNLYSYVNNDPVNNTDPTGLLLANPDEDPSSPCGFTVWGQALGDGWIRVFGGFWTCPVANGGGNTGGSGPASPALGQRVPLSGAKLAKFIFEKIQLVNLLQTTSACSVFLLTKLGNKDGEGNGIIKSLNSQITYDGDLSTIDAGLAGFWVGTGTPINVFLSGGDAGTSSENIPLIGTTNRDVYYTAIGIKAAVILHETLHIHLNGIGDRSLANKLGVDPAKYAREGSRATTELLEQQGCK